jgi:hypothetical protein
MALSKGTNSNVTVEEADLYFADRLDVAAWTAAGAEEKGLALVTATSMLEGLTLAGYAVSETQALAFPRVGDYFDPRLGLSVSFPETGAPLRWLKATYELAYHLLNNDGLLDDTGEVKDLEVYGIKLANIRSANKLPSVVNNLVRPMLVNAGAQAWWRAN